MRVFLFQPRFAPLVAAGTKHQTIRLQARCQPGDTLSLRQWSGKPYRSKQQLLGTVTCVDVVSVRLFDSGVILCGRGWIGMSNGFARADGFADWDEMRAWFEATHGLPFSGELITWWPLRREAPSQQATPEAPHV